jgi:hypothetical protein
MEGSGAPLFPEQELAAFKGRSNMVNASSESWRPQLFAATTTRLLSSSGRGAQILRHSGGLCVA